MTDDSIKQQDINNAAWAACDTFRGVMDAANYKDYILVMLFLKKEIDTIERELVKVRRKMATFLKEVAT